MNTKKTSHADDLFARIEERAELRRRIPAILLALLSVARTVNETGGRLRFDDGKPYLFFGKYHSVGFRVVGRGRQKSSVILCVDGKTYEVARRSADDPFADCEWRTLHGIYCVLNGILKSVADGRNTFAGAFRKKFGILNV